MPIYFSENLVYLREKKNLTQQQLAVKLCEACNIEIKLKRYQAWEENRAFPGPRILVKLCDVLEYKDIYALISKRLNP